jgi:hypothetical protein
VDTKETPRQHATIEELAKFPFDEPRHVPLALPLAG